MIRNAELVATGLYPTTRTFMELLWPQPEKVPRAPDDKNRKAHKIDEHIKICVTDLPFAAPGDKDDSRILITDKSSENYECSNVPGIQRCYNIILFRIASEGGGINEVQTVYLRVAFCSCDNCRGPKFSDDFKNWR